MSVLHNEALVKRLWSKYTFTYDPLKAGSIDGTDTVPHDKAVSRAMSVTYKAGKRLQSSPENTIFVARLDKRTTEDCIKNAFSNFGTVKSCSLVKDIVTGESKCYAFVEYKSKHDACNAYLRGRTLILDRKKVLVDFECERLLPGWVPRRLGGGFGGNKTSGQLRFGCRDRPFKKPIKFLTSQEVQKEYKTRY